MIYLRKFENHAAYEAAESSLILPNVSLCVQENEVHYNPSTPPTPSHDYVEIGGIKWATMNIGATGITDAGLYFQWGDTQGYTVAQVGSGVDKKFFDWGDYKFNPSGDGTTFTKYNYSDVLYLLQSSDDAVTAAWGGNWRMPTTEEFQALLTATTTAWTADYEGSGVAGLVLTSNADSSKKLFFPAAGYAEQGVINRVGEYVPYYSNHLFDESEDCAFYMETYSGKGYVSWSGNMYRCNGCPVRGVLADN